MQRLPWGLMVAGTSLPGRVDVVSMLKLWRRVSVRHLRRSSGWSDRSDHRFHAATPKLLHGTVIQGTSNAGERGCRRGSDCLWG